MSVVRKTTILFGTGVLVVCKKCINHHISCYLSHYSTTIFIIFLGLKGLSQYPFSCLFISTFHGFLLLLTSLSNGDSITGCFHDDVACKKHQAYPLCDSSPNENFQTGYPIGREEGQARYSCVSPPCPPTGYLYLE